jgi:hypothetical protein
MISSVRCDARTVLIRYKLVRRLIRRNVRGCVRGVQLLWLLLHVFADASDGGGKYRYDENRDCGQC